LAIAQFLESFHIISRWKKVIRFMSVFSIAKEIQDLSKNRWFLSVLGKAADHYQVSPASSDVVLLQSERVVMAPSVDPKMGWSEFAEGQLLHYRIPGWHEYMYRDDGAVAAMAEQLRPLLERCERPADALERCSERHRA
jgi:hypothetical protein